MISLNCGELPHIHHGENKFEKKQGFRGFFAPQHSTPALGMLLLELLSNFTLGRGWIDSWTPLALSSHHTHARLISADAKLLCSTQKM